jgi:DNA-directed RNA polymerase specialized sigma24 family protein
MNETGSHDDRQARQFTELFTDNYGPVLAYVRRRVSPDLAQDVVADTFLAAWRNIHELPPEPLPWLAAKLTAGAVMARHGGFAHAGAAAKVAPGRPVRIP